MILFAICTIFVICLTGRKVVVLVDEYDKALVNTIDDPLKHEELRLFLKGFSPYEIFDYRAGETSIVPAYVPKYGLDFKEST